MTPQHAKPQVLWEDNHLLVVNKPAGIATMGASAGETSLVDLCKDYLRVKYQKPGNVYLGVVSRLDAAVAGTVVLARTSKAADRLNRQFRERTVEKQYWALVSGSVRVSPFDWHDSLLHDDAQHRVLVVPRDTPESKMAHLSGKRLATIPGGNLLEIQLHTGRKHQIRVQAAHRHHPILGDRKYGSRVAFPEGIGLFSRRIRFAHPISQDLIEVIAPVPRSWSPWTQSLNS